MTERQESHGPREAADPAALGWSATNTHWRNHLLVLTRGEKSKPIEWMSTPGLASRAAPLQGGFCVDDQTEALTPNRWRRHRDLADR
jgi:hypothetical protein